MARQRRPTDDQKTEIYDSRKPKPRAKTATKKGFESGDSHETLDIGTPTEIDLSLRAREAARQDRSEPIKVISMKAPEADKKRGEAKQHKPEIRSLSDVLPRSATPPRGMGRLAPPADPKQARVRRLRDWLIWGSVLVIISCVVMLGVWFLAGR